MLMDPWTRRVVYSKNPHLELSPASTLKIMTALTALKNSHLKKKVVVSKLASSMEPSKVYIKKEEIYFVEDLLRAILLNSGNDARSYIVCPMALVGLEATSIIRVSV